MFVELHAASAFSFLHGASLPETLVDRAAALGYPAVALLDRDGVYGAPRFHKAARAAGIRPIVGAELTMRNVALRTQNVELKARPHPAAFSVLRSQFLLPVLCESPEGYRNLCRLITTMKLRAPKGEGALTFEDLDGHTAGLVALTGRAALDGRRHGVGGLLDRLVGVFGRGSVYVELQRHFRRDEEADTGALVALADTFRVPLVATNGVRFAMPADRPLFDVLTCLHHHTDLVTAGRWLAPNAERYLKAPDVMAALFADHADAVARTADLADRLQYSMADLDYRFPDYPVPSGETQASFLRKITDVGARERYRPYHDRARAQVARELDLIEKLRLAGYFLIVWDIVNFCRQHDILAQGRGSAANSAVCYSLGITAVDPVGMDLLFERFLSEERGEWPDIDLDLPSGDRREQVIQHVYGKYGRLGAAMTANVITYRGRSAAREVGKVLGFDPAQVDRLAKAMNHFEFTDPADPSTLQGATSSGSPRATSRGDTLPEHLSAVGLDAQTDRVRLFATLWREMQDLPRHLGQHSGGMVMCRGQLDAVVPLEPASMPGRVVVQWDKDDCADMGIVKVDLLGLGMMAVIQDSLALVNGRSSSSHPPSQAALASARQAQPPATPPSLVCAVDELRRARQSAAGATAGSPYVDLAHLPENDPAVYKMLQEADTIGVFQVESRAQMATLPRLKPACFYDIVVQVAIIRPGPIVGQMVHPYVNRRAGREAVQYPHPSLEPILARTLGVPLFQEQLLRIAMVAAGFTGGQAEALRRAMGFKRSERRMKDIEGQLREGMAGRGITGDAAEEIIRSIASFALYGFPESHAASFALLAYASAYLKAHYPAAFYTALLNNQPMGFYHPATLVKDAQRRGVRFQSVDVQRSHWDCTVEPDGAIRLGLRYVNGLREQAGRAIASPQPSGLRSLGPDASYGQARHSAEGAAAAAPGHPPSQATPASAGQAQPPAFAGAARFGGASQATNSALCPKCGCDDESMLERTDEGGMFCNVCSNEWTLRSTAGIPGSARDESLERRSGKRFTSLDDLVARAGLRRDEVVTLADVGALNAFGYDRRSALWQAERAVRPSGELFDETINAESAELAEEDFPATPPSLVGAVTQLRRARQSAEGATAGSPQPPAFAGSPASAGKPATDSCPLNPMTESERLVADYAGMGLTVGRHPMALRREELAMRGILRAIDLKAARQGRRVRVAGMVITRQRPGTAKGFVFLTLEDETGVANIIVRPDLYARDRRVLIEEPFLIVDGVLQNQDGVTSIRAEQVQGLKGVDVTVAAHDFY